MAPSYKIPALIRTFEVIDCISKHPDGIAFSDIVSATGAPKTSVFRILYTLESSSWIEKRHECYFLGDMLIHYGMTTLSRRRINEVARPIMTTLVQQLGETAHLAVLSGRQSLILEVCEARGHLKLTSTPGSLLPLYCTSHGKIFLTHIIGEDLEGFYYGETLERRTPHTITDLVRLREELDKIRRDGHSVDNQEYHENVRCCAAPVFGKGGRCIAAVGVTGSTITCTPERLDEVAGLVKTAAAAISRQMGQLE